MKPPCGAIRGMATRKETRITPGGLHPGYLLPARLRQAVKASFDAPCVTSEHSMVQNVSDGITNPSRHPGETPLRWLRRLGLNTYADEVLAYYRRRFGGG